jgi:hypothetical protein
MGKYLLIILATVSVSLKSNNSKKDLLCHHWVQFASKSEIGAPVKPTGASLAEDITIKPDGTYEESLYNGQFKATGNWYVNDNETKLEFTTSTVNGKPIPPFPETTRHYTIVILKLTIDTLIYGNEFYRTKKGEPTVYNHSDLYFARKD